MSTGGAAARAALSEIKLVAQNVPVTVAAVAGSVESSGSVSGVQVYLSAVFGEVAITGDIPYVGWQGYIQSPPVALVVQAWVAGVSFFLTPEAAQAQLDTLTGQMVGPVQILKVAAAEISLAGSIPEFLFYCRPPIAQAGLSPSCLFIHLVLSLVPVAIEIVPVASVRQFSVESPVVTYRCILTGAADGLLDLIIPISSFQIRKRVIE